ncbi:MAG: citrate/2-methylcitrate synthase [Anaerotruncus massiliensis (ex Togo et al. 2019)]
MLRSDKQFTEEEAHLLDLCLTLHSEHGGGNCSTFAVRVLTSAQTDTYSAIAAGIGALKGPRHGGANHKVIEQLEYLKANVYDWDDDNEIREYLRKAVAGEAGDRSGLIYGMGHAVYTKSDPRARVLKQNAMKLAKGTDYGRVPPARRGRAAGADVLRKVGQRPDHRANVDLYSGIYRMRIDELHTPSSRRARRAVHRLEELSTGKKIIRPAYTAIVGAHSYVPLAQRG